MTALRAAGTYAVVLVVMRLSGKRAIGNFTAFDFLVALMIGEVVDEMIYGDVYFGQGLVAIGTVALLQYANSWLSYYDHGMDKYLEGQPTPLIHNGKYDRKGMRKERMNEKDVMHELRLRGITDMREVKLALVENDGEVSVIREDWAQPLQKSDLDRRGKAEDEEDVPPSKRSDAPSKLK